MAQMYWADKCAAVIQKCMGPAFDWCAVRYQAKVGKELKKWGLRYDDLYDDLYDLDIKEAMHRLPTHVLDLRNQRLKRAMDMGIKHVYMDKRMQAKMTPFEYYLQDLLKQVKAERWEREETGSDMPYNRELP